MEKRHTTKFHAEASLHASLKGAKIRPLSELLRAHDELSVSSFDAATDEKMTRIAEENLKKRQAEVLEKLRNGRQ